MIFLILLTVASSSGGTGYVRPYSLPYRKRSSREFGELDDNTDQIGHDD
jgi:hypothetical protein